MSATLETLIKKTQQPDSTWSQLSSEGNFYFSQKKSAASTEVDLFMNYDPITHLRWAKLRMETNNNDWTYMQMQLNTTDNVAVRITIDQVAKGACIAINIAQGQDTGGFVINQRSKPTTFKPIESSSADLSQAALLYYAYTLGVIDKLYARGLAGPPNHEILTRFELKRSDHAF